MTLYVTPNNKKDLENIKRLFPEQMKILLDHMKICKKCIVIDSNKNLERHEKYKKMLMETELNVVIDNEFYLRHIVRYFLEHEHSFKIKVFEDPIIPQDTFRYFAFSRRSPYVEKFNLILTLFVESGISEFNYDNHYTNIVYNTIKNALKKGKFKTDEDISKFALETLGTAGNSKYTKDVSAELSTPIDMKIYFIVGLFLLCFIVFIFEIIHYLLAKRRAIKLLERTTWARRRRILRRGQRPIIV